MSSPFRYEVAAHAAVIIFNRPEAMNAFTRAMVPELLALLDRAEANDGVRAIILTGAGRMFCAGADLSGGPAAFAEAADIAPSDEAARDFGGLITLRLFDCLKPVIVAFNGSAAGMGVTMALAADFRLAVPGAKFVLPFARRGIAPESASAWFLPRIVGLPKALDWMMTGRAVPAAEALEAGLVGALHEPEALLPAAHSIVAEIAANTAPVSVALTRQMLWRLAAADHPMEAHKVESRGIRARSAAADVKEGVASFLEKRQPDFPDRISADMPDFFPWWQERRYE